MAWRAATFHYDADDPLRQLLGGGETQNHYSNQHQEFSTLISKTKKDGDWGSFGLFWPMHYRIRRCMYITPPWGGFQARLFDKQEGVNTERYVFGKLSMRCSQRRPIWHRHYSNCGDIDNGISARRGVIYSTRYTVYGIPGNHYCKITRDGGKKVRPAALMSELSDYTTRGVRKASEKATRKYMKIK